MFKFFLILAVERSILVIQMLTLGWDYPLVNLLEVEKKFFKKKKPFTHYPRSITA